MKRIPPPVWLLFGILLMTTLHFFIPVRDVVPTPFNLAGLVVVVASLLIFGWSARWIFRAKTTIIPFRESSALVTTGPFRVSRNPIYLAMALLLLGSAILFGTLTPLFVMPVFVILIDRVFILGEQRMLRETFGDAYQDYCRSVRRWF